MLPSTKDPDWRGSFSGYERDHLFFNADGSAERLYDAGYALGLDFDDDGRSAVAVDVDGDGDLDLAHLSLQRLRVLENTGPPRSFARVRLRATSGEAHALGAVATLEANGLRQRDHLRVTEGFQSQVPLELHFGLGAATSIDSVTVAWPSGATETWRDLEVGKLLVLTEGRREAEVLDVPRWPDESRPPAVVGASLDHEALRAEGPAGARAALAPGGRPAVVNFWAPWCAPCRAELPHLAELARELAGAVDFVGVNVDPGGEDAALLEQLGVAYPQFLADGELLAAFFEDPERIPLPATFVFDAEGEVRRVFRRAIDGEDLGGILESFLSAGDFVHDIVRMARIHVQRGELQEGFELLQRALDADPEEVDAHQEIGKLYALAGQDAEAEAAFATAVRLDPELAQAHYNLGVSRMKLGHPARAIAPIEASLRITGDSIEPLLALGSAAANAGFFPRALDAFDRALVLEPLDPRLHALRGRVLSELGSIDEARRAYERALELDSTYAAARAQLERLDD